MRRSTAAANVLLASILAMALSGPASCQPFQPGNNLTPLGNLRTSDRDGPYNISLLSTQVNEVRAGARARDNYTDKDIIDFLTNVECLEGQFDTWGTFGRGFTGNLALGGPNPIGARKANLTERTLAYLQEVALNEQGHALLTRQAGGTNPCPVTAPTQGFNELFAVAYNLTGTVEQGFGAPFDPYLNDVNFVLSVLTLEELGATGNKGLAGILINPVHASAVAGLATSATAQATVERFLLWQMRNEIVQPFKETAQQVFARVSAYRDMMDGAPFDDQGIVNTDPRFIAVPDSFVNLIPTDIRGLTFSRTPQQNLRILFIGRETSGGFFPNGIPGKINSSVGYNLTSSGISNWPSDATLATEASVASIGALPPPITAGGPFTVPGEDQLTQALDGKRQGTGPANRGLLPVPPAGKVNVNGGPLEVGTPGGILPAAAPALGPSTGIQSGAVAPAVAPAAGASPALASPPKVPVTVTVPNIAPASSGLGGATVIVPPKSIPKLAAPNGAPPVVLPITAAPPVVGPPQAVAPAGGPAVNAAAGPAAGSATGPAASGPAVGPASSRRLLAQQ